MAMRIARFLARAGVAARRKAEAFVLEGRVAVDGTVVRELHTQIEPHHRVTLDGQPVQVPSAPVTIVLNKPIHYLVSRTDPGNRPTVYDLLIGLDAEARDRLVYVGRLDWDTEGLLLLTTDGDLANRCTHPRYHLQKEYHLRTTPELTEADLVRLRAGVMLEDGPAEAIEASRPQSRIMNAAITIAEGRNRQVRRMVEAVGARVDRLRRVRFGPIRLGGMAGGVWRLLDDRERAALYEAVGLPAPDSSEGDAVAPAGKE